MESSSQEFIENLKKHPEGQKLARMIFGVMTETKFLQLYDVLIPVNDGPLDYLLNEVQCKELLLNRFMELDKHSNDKHEQEEESLVYFKYTVKMMYDNYVKEFKREPNLSGIAWIVKEKHRSNAAHLKMIMSFNGYKLVERKVQECGIFDADTQWEYMHVDNGKEGSVWGSQLTKDMKSVQMCITRFNKVMRKGLTCVETRCRRMNSGNTWYNIESIDFDDY
ncbi:unnamed protein product [Oikopleura dioica]|uniref:Uncharacterized protein n=1 Tax=Oikopleura dioica TaxID=34765 RepID=E4WZJ5_OIKDI|nr:unnamed protein product [Oikopleura dioica]CBY38830.1 unnamed protein product [Oikopleura dioica]